MTSTTGATMPRIAKFTHKKDLPFREYILQGVHFVLSQSFSYSKKLNFPIMNSFYLFYMFSM